MAKTALLVMDVQNGIVERLGAAAPAYLKKVQASVEAARQHKVPVIFVTVCFRDGFPEISPHNKSFSAIKGNASDMSETSEAAQVAVEVQPGDITLTKRRVSAFTGSDLEVVLRSLEAQELVLSGIATSGVVLSTLREAADKDYQLMVLSDLCTDFDNEVHRVLTEKVFPRQAEVVTSEAWLQNLSKEGGSPS